MLIVQQTHPPYVHFPGCHDYDISALNIVLGLAFDFDESEYIESNKFFVSASEEYKETEFKSDLNETIVRGNLTHDLFGDLTQDIPWERMWLPICVHCTYIISAKNSNKM